EQTLTQFGFQFDKYGVRVPTLLISPYIKPNTLFRSPTDVPFDHTSIIKTILEWKGLYTKDAQQRLGQRVRYAPSFAGVLSGNAGDGMVEGRRPKDHRKLGTHPRDR